MKEPAWKHFAYWGSLALVLAGGMALAAALPSLFTPGLDGLFFLGLFFLHMGAGHLAGYQGMLHRRYRAAPWRRDYQRALALAYGLMGLGWMAGSLLPQGVGIYAVIFALAAGLLYSGRRLQQLRSAAPRGDLKEKE